MSLDVQIKVDPGNSVQAANAVTASLHKTEDEGIAAKKAMDNLTGTFARLANVLETDMKRAAEQTRAEQAALGKQLSATGKAFDGLTQAIAREKEMLDLIHGPTKQAQQDLQALEMLHKRGAITAQQYAAELARIQQSSGLGGAVPGGGMSSIAAGISKLNVGQIAGGANQAFELLNQKLHITDSKLGDAIGSAVKFGAAGAQIAGPWGAAIGALTGGLIAAGDALDELMDAEGAREHKTWLMQLEAEVYWNQEIAKSYKEAREGLLAWEQEKDRSEAQKNTAKNNAIDDAQTSVGREINEIRERERQLRIALVQARQDRQMGSGSLGSTVSTQEVVIARQLRDVTIENSNAGTTYAKTLSTIQLAEAHRLDQQIDLRKALDAGKLSLEKYNQELVKVGGTDFDTAVAKASLSLTEPVSNAKRDLAALDAAWKTTVDKSGGSMKLYRDQRKALQETISGQPITDYYTEQLKAITQPEKDWNGRLHALAVLLKNQRITVEQYTVALKGLSTAYLGIDLSTIGLGGAGLKPGVARQNSIDADNALRFASQQSMLEAEAEGRRNEARGIVAEPMDFPIEAMLKGVNAAKEIEERLTSVGDIMRDQVVGSARDFASTLVDAANGADVSWGDFFKSMLVGLEKAIAQALILKAITGSVTGSAGAGGYGGLFGLLGFATGGDAIMGASRLRRIPAAATGYDGIIGGSGGTDSKLAMIRATPGELVSVRTPQQVRAEASRSSAPSVNIVNQAADPRALLPMLNTPSGERAILNVMQKYPDAVRALIR